MPNCDVAQDKRLALTERIIEAKLKRGLTWDAVAQAAGLSTTFVTAACLGQHPLPEASARQLCEKLGLDDADVITLQTIPMRGSLATQIPTDPTIYRFYEIVQVYGTTLKALIHEKFGDGIMSAINFKMDIQKVEDPEGGSRVIIKMDGKYLPNRPY